MDIVKLQSYSNESGVNFVLPLVTRGRRGKNMYFVVWPCQDPWDARKTGQVTTALANNCPSPRQQLLRLHICSGFTTDMCWDNCPCVTTDQVGQTLVWIFRLGVNFIFPYPKNKNNNNNPSQRSLGLEISIYGEYVSGAMKARILISWKFELKRSSINMCFFPVCYVCVCIHNLCVCPVCSLDFIVWASPCLLFDLIVCTSNNFWY